MPYYILSRTIYHNTNITIHSYQYYIKGIIILRYHCTNNCDLTSNNATLHYYTLLHTITPIQSTTSPLQRNYTTHIYNHTLHAIQWHKTAYAGIYGRYKRYILQSYIIILILISIILISNHLCC